MADIEYSEMRGRNGTEPGDVLLNLASAARQAVCGIYRASPGAIVGNDAAIDPIGVGRAVAGFYDRMCSDTGPMPTLPPSPGTGQCPGTIYRVQIAWKWFQFTGTTDRNLPGPIGPIKYRDTPGNNYEAFHEYGTQTPRQTAFIINVDQADANRKANLSASFTSITPVSGVDNCGQIAPTFPRAPLPPGGFSPTVPYRDRDGIRNVPVRIFPVPVPVGINVTPTVNVQIGEINFNFDLKGAKLFPINLDLTVPINIGPGTDVQPNPNPPKEDPGEGLDPKAISDRFDRLEDLLEELKDCACKEEGDLTTTQFATNVTSFVKTGLPEGRNKFCAIALTKLPQDDKRINGENAPDVIFAGWAWFVGANGYTSERMPVDAAGKLFKNPGGFTGFAFTLQKGCRGNAFQLDAPIPPP